jgi:taurine dioxygenase
MTIKPRSPFLGAEIEGVNLYGADRHLTFREADRDSFSEASRHPLVRTHSETGRHALYIHPLKMWSIEGMTTEESETLVNELLNATIDLSEIYRHQWRLGASC